MFNLPHFLFCGKLVQIERIIIHEIFKRNIDKQIVEPRYSHTLSKPEENGRIQDLIIDSYLEIIQQIQLDPIQEFIRVNNSIINEQINSKYDTQLLFRQPIILLVYYLIEKYPNKVKSSWPLTENLIKPIYIKLGMSLED